MAKNKLYSEMYEEYKEGYSLSEIGKMHGMTRQSVYAGFRCRGCILRNKNVLPYLTFNGVKFTLRNHGYYARTDGDRCLMHRYVWNYYKGKIPDGWDVHHINHDRTDNR